VAGFGGGRLDAVDLVPDGCVLRGRGIALSDRDGVDSGGVDRMEPCAADHRGRDLVFELAPQAGSQDSQGSEADFRIYGSDRAVREAVERVLVGAVAAGGGDGASGVRTF